MIKKFIFIIFVLIVFFGCSPTGYFIAENANTSFNVENTSVIYALPRTSFKINIEYAKVIRKKGPYRDYADTFLGIKDVMANDSVFWRVTNIQIEPLTEIDPEQYYMVKSFDTRLDIEKFTSYLEENVLLTSYPAVSNNMLFKTNELIHQDEQEIVFTDLSVKRNLKEIIDTVYRTRYVDTLFTRIPIYKRELGMKNLEEKAQEAANFIIKIRKRRFKLLAGQYDVFPEGQALAISVKELNALEKEYLSMFMGKEEEIYFTESFYYTPSTHGDDEEIMICRFSPEKGIVDINDKESQPVVLTISPLNLTVSLRDRLSELADKTNKIMFRVPDIASVKVKFNNKILVEGRFTVHQFGEVVMLPAYFLLQNPE